MSVSAVKAADVVLIPVQPSAADLWAASDLVDILVARRSVTDGRPHAAFVVSRQIPGTRLASGIQEVLDGYGLPVLAARTSQRVAYAEALAAGLSVIDHEPDGKAADEIRAVLDEIEPLSPPKPPDSWPRPRRQIPSAASPRNPPPTSATSTTSSARSPTNPASQRPSRSGREGRAWPKAQSGKERNEDRLIGR